MTPAPPFSTLADESKIPEFLRLTARWCGWQLRPNPGGKPTKVPSIRTNDPTAWLPYEKVAHVRCWSEEGRGFCMFGGVTGRLGDGTTVYLVLLDLDACRNPQSGKLESWAVDTIEAFGRSYTEASPSGTGVRIAVWVKKLTPLKGKVAITAAAPPGVKKKPELQLFIRAGYCTITEQRLEGTSAEILVVESLEWLHGFGFQAEANAKNGQVLPTGSGEAPTFDAITERVQQHRHGKALIAADWKAVLPDKTASEAFGVLEALALEAAHGHGEQAVRWLLGETAWGRGDVDDSADPSKYERWSWVAKDLARVVGKGFGGGDPVAEFEVLTEAPVAGPETKKRGVLLRKRGSDELEAEPPVKWLVDNVLPESGGTVLGGMTSVGKSLLMEDLTCAGASGATSWFGHRITAPFSTLFLAAEGAGGHGVRRRAWRAAHPDLHRVDGHDVIVADGTIDLCASGALERLVAEWESTRPMCGGHAPKVVVIDTLAIAAAGADMNDASEVSRVLAMLAIFIRRTGCVVVLVHHLRKPSGNTRGQHVDLHSLRGSSAIAAAADVVLLATTGKHGYELSVDKARDGECRKLLDYQIVGRPTGRTLDDGRPEFGPVIVAATVAALDLSELREPASKTSAEPPVTGAPTSGDSVIDALMRTVHQRGDEPLSTTALATAVRLRADTVRGALKRAIALRWLVPGEQVGRRVRYRVGTGPAAAAAEAAS